MIVRATEPTVNPPFEGRVKGRSLSMAMRRIGDLSQRTGIPVKTLRCHDDIGILPAADRSASGHRLYDDCALGKAGFVRAAQAVGLGLGESREVIALRDRGTAPCAHVLELVNRRRAELGKRIFGLESFRDQLGGLARRAGRLDPRDGAPDGVCHLIDATVTATRAAPGARPGRRTS